MPNHEALMREHARLHVAILNLPTLCGLNNECFVRLSDVIDLLVLPDSDHVVTNSARPECSPKKK